jgi:hypothetical protein
MMIMDAWMDRQDHTNNQSRSIICNVPTARSVKLKEEDCKELSRERGKRQSEGSVSVLNGLWQRQHCTQRLPCLYLHAHSYRTCISTANSLLLKLEIWKKIWTPLLATSGIAGSLN